MRPRRGRAPVGLLLVAAAVLAGSGSSGHAGEANVEKTILSTFEQIDKVPRCSKDESRISAWLVDWAQSRKLQATQDAFRNVLITVPASPGWESRPGVVLQSHMDMVCLKTEGSSHDFTRDAIPLLRKGGWISAKDTTLGADDGIGIAISLTMAEAPVTPHPRLEVLVTADEERDMTGASGLASNVLTGTRFINLDSESDAVLTLGSAGGMHTDLTLPLDATPLAADVPSFKLKVSGLAGGHSGVDINKKRANASVLAARLLAEAGSFRLVSLNGGTAPNVISTSAEAVFAMDRAGAAALKRRIKTFIAEAKRQYPDERRMSITLASIPHAKDPAASPERSAAAVKLIASLPQGVTAWSKEFPGLPETSNNVGVVATRKGVLEISTFQRSFHSDALKEVAAQISSVGNTFGASSNHGAEFPAWPPNSDTALAAAVRSSYRKLHGSDMKVQVIHAGLECGNFAGKYPAMEIVSIGPTIRDAHSTRESLEVSSVMRTWRLLGAVLQAQ